MPEITLNNLDSGHDERFSIQSRPLGRGRFSTVHQVTNSTNRKYALKRTKLNAKDTTGHRLLRNEVRTLKALGMLKGFKIDRAKGEYSILMTLIPGNTNEIELSNCTNQHGKKILHSAFTTLKDLHSQGIIHTDPKPSNFIYDRDLNKSTAIDYGFAWDKGGCINGGVDYLLCAYKRYYDVGNLRGIPRDLYELSQQITNIASAFKQHILEIVDNMQRNKMRTAFKIFVGCAIAASIIYGFAIFEAARIITFLVLRSVALNEMTNFLQFAAHGLRVTEYAKKLPLSPIVSVINIICATTIAKWLYSNRESIKIAASITKDLLTGNVYAALTTSKAPVNIARLALFYYPLRQTKRFIQEEIDANFSATDKFATECEKITYDKPWFARCNLFNRQPRI